MVNSQSSRIALGKYDPFQRTPSLKSKMEKSSFFGPMDTGSIRDVVAAFPPGAHVEYRVQRVTCTSSDHSQALARTLWVIEPSGSRSYWLAVLPLR
jgi:hypothetical protein